MDLEEKKSSFRPFDLQLGEQGLRCDTEKMLHGHARRVLGLSIGFVSMCSTRELIQLFVNRGWEWLPRN